MTDITSNRLAAVLEGAAAMQATIDQLRRDLAEREHDLRNAQQRCIALEHAAEVLAAENAEVKADVLRQAARIAALESENAVLQRELDRLRSQVVDALSSAGPEVGEDERAP